MTLTLPHVGAFAALIAGEFMPSCESEHLSTSQDLKGWIRPVTAEAYKALRPYRDDFPYRVEIVDGNRQMYFSRSNFEECIDALHAAGISVWVPGHGFLAPSPKRST